MWGSKGISFQERAFSLEDENRFSRLEKSVESIKELLKGSTQASPKQFRKIIMRYKRIGYNLNVMRHSACLIINPIMVDGYAALFNCTPVDRASDSIMAPT